MLQCQAYHQFLRLCNSTKTSLQLSKFFFRPLIIIIIIIIISIIRSKVSKGAKIRNRYN